MLLSNGGFCQYENSPAVKNSLFLSYVAKKNIYAIIRLYPPFFRSKERVAAEGKIKIWQQRRQKKGQDYAFRKKVAAVFEGGKTNEGELKQI